MDFEFSLWLIVQAFWFMSRVAHHYHPGEQIVYHLEATGLRGRKLVFANAQGFWRPTEECRAAKYLEDAEAEVEKMRTAWDELCLGVLHGFFRLFAGDSIQRSTLAKWIETFKERGV